MSHVIFRNSCNNNYNPWLTGPQDLSNQITFKNPHKWTKALFFNVKRQYPPPSPATAPTCFVSFAPVDVPIHYNVCVVYKEHLEMTNNTLPRRHTKNRNVCTSLCVLA